MSSLYRQAVADLESRTIMPEGPPSLEPTREGLRLVLGDSVIDPNRVIVVAGTNGKGSVCASLEALLLDASQTVGLFTSPHLEETTERIRINGVDISPEVFCDAYTAVLEKTRELNLTHFEMLTLMAAWIFFSDQTGTQITWAIFEVGLGGTWDSTNAIPHHWNVITALGYDHQNILGKTLGEIAANKFGIIGKDGVVVHAPLPDEVQGLAKQVQKETHSSWTESTSFSLSTRRARPEPVFELQTKWGKTPLKLAGRRAGQNSAVALSVFHALGFAPEKHIHALAQVRWPGRMERLELPQACCPVYLSGDHNEPGVASLLELLPDYERNHLFILAGVGKDKALDSILGPLFALPNTTVILTETPFRGRAVDSYGEWLSRAESAWAEPEKAFQHVLSLAGPQDMILVTGSLYLAGRILKLFKKSL